MRFKLATMLICAWIVAATAFLCKAVPVRDYKRVPTVTDHVTVHYGLEAFSRPPTTAEFAWRLAWCGPTAVILTLAAMRAARWAFKDWLSWARYNSAMKLRFTLRDLLLATALIALATAWRVDSARKVQTIQTQDKIIKNLETIEQTQHQRLGQFEDSTRAMNEGIKRLTKRLETYKTKYPETQWDD
jgi:hypothetical protein